MLVSKGVVQTGEPGERNWLNRCVLPGTYSAKSANETLNDALSGRQMEIKD